MSNKTLLIIIAVLLLLFAGAVVYFRNSGSVVTSDEYGTDNKTASTPPGSVGLNTQDQTQQPSSTQDSTKATTMSDCKRNFDENKLKSDKVAIANRVVEIDVKDFGKIQLELYDKDAPKTVENFLRLTNAGFYNCLTFHRVSRGFVIQGGDPNGDGTGGISAFGAKFADELYPDTASYKTGYRKGVLAMANSGPNTNGSQFFIMLEDKELPHAYTIFGKVISGQDVVDKIGKLPVVPGMFGPEDGQPATAVVMQSVSIVK